MDAGVLARGGTNWFAPSFDPETNLFYVNAIKGYSLAYLTDTEENPKATAAVAVTCGRIDIPKLGGDTLPVAFQAYTHHSGSPMSIKRV